ncbi:hypothetical protein [Aquirhabdus parva]|nr:hypothetical protein [Aquirhabdus parva]
MMIVSARTGAMMKKIFFLQYMMIGLFVVTFGLCLEKLVYFSPSIKWMIYLGGGVLIILAFTLLDHLYRSALSPRSEESLSREMMDIEMQQKTH